MSTDGTTLRSEGDVPAREPEILEPFHAGAKKRMLIIVNPYATTVSDRLRHLVVYALQGRYEVDAVDTEARGHAIELCREAAHEGYEVVVAFGGDGTVNEAANGLRGSPTPLTCLPGGSANVYGKILGIPGELVDATEHLLAMADDWCPRKVDLGVVNGRCFAFASGLGLDASVVKRVDSNPHLKARFGAYYFTWAAFSTFTRRYILKPPHLVLEAGGEEHKGVTAILQNGSPFTYFKDRPIEVADGPALDSGTLRACVLHRARPLDMPSIAYRAFSKRARVARHRHVTQLAETSELRVRSSDGEPLPLQVDGDYLGDVIEARYSILPGELSVIS
ncbi:MAG TPA: diacylglycerol kinase family protein [Solirubrobacteraceae bacterium]|jgi:diacylglycerol kinase family enzyme